MRETITSEGMEKLAERPLDLETIKAFILDMDGVVTDTARVHAAAWKQTFDQYLQERTERYGEHFYPFDEKDDYLRYLDGKPRCEGIRDFFNSRGISLPWGEIDDPPEKETICGIGNKKRDLFLRMLGSGGISPFQSTVEFVRRLQSLGLRPALVSSSCNARIVLRILGLSDLFKIVVDGTDAVQLNLNGKPHPDLFIEAARRLNVRPEQAAIVEDAIAGIEAGRAGGFGLVIGLDNDGRERDLKDHGADIVVRELSDLIGGLAPGKSSLPPSAFDNLKKIYHRLQQGSPTVLLDYDGTLTPIAQRPSLAILSEEMRETLRRLSMVCPVAIVSGRDLGDVQRMVGLDCLYYIGSHGFESASPDGQSCIREQGKRFLPALDEAEKELRASIREVKGAFVERKRFAVALHYRESDPRDIAELERRFSRVSRQHPDLRRTGGKKVFELRPNIDWDKGRAVLALLDTFHTDGSSASTLYIGDDVTDEDAFRATRDKGVSILVTDHDQVTAAGYTLRDVPEVHAFLERLIGMFEDEPAEKAWSLQYDGFEPEKERLRETLCTTGNGYMASRGAATESSAGKLHYPGTYLAGIYNRRTSTIEGRNVENESIVNAPNWLPLSFSIDDGDSIDLCAIEPGNYRQQLDMRHGTLNRTLSFTDRHGRRTRVRQRRFVSMNDPHIAALETIITPENWSGKVHLVSALDGRVENVMVERYLPFDNHHLDLVGTGADGRQTIWLEVETNQSHIRIAEAARTKVFNCLGTSGSEYSASEQPGCVGLEIDAPVSAGRPIRIEKIVTIYSSRDPGISESLSQALSALEHAPSFAQLLRNHRQAWSSLWDRCQIKVEAEDEVIAQILNLHIFHLIQTVSPHTIGMDSGLPPRGLHGEAYRGLIMWDELFILPFLNLRIPELARSLLLYRYRRLPWAQWEANNEGLRGAMFPWQSGSDGKEMCQVIHLNPNSGEWIPDHSRLEHHIGLAIGYNVWRYYQATGDRDFMSSYGVKMLVEIARFWASKATYNKSRSRYDILGVMGPDEFHEKYPNAEEPGINNNAYTNILASWLFRRTLDAIRLLSSDQRKDLLDQLSVSTEEVDLWLDISRRLFVPFHGDGVISQFEGYDQLNDLDWQRYRNEYGDIHRLDRILKAEGDYPDRYKLSKQADVLMLFYLFSPDELEELLIGLGYSWQPEMMSRNINYYMDRVSHGSTLSRLVHAWVLSRVDHERSWSLFLEALRSDVSDSQGGTTAEGIHLGAMAGTVDMIQRCYSGLEIRDEVLWFNPNLPSGLSRLCFEIQYRQRRLLVEIGKDGLRLVGNQQNTASIPIGFGGRIYAILPGASMSFNLT